MQLFVCWCDGEVSQEVTKPRYGSVYPWPLRKIIPHWKQIEIRKKLHCIGWEQKSTEEVGLFFFNPFVKLSIETARVIPAMHVPYLWSVRALGTWVMSWGMLSLMSRTRSHTTHMVRCQVPRADSMSDRRKKTDPVTEMGRYGYI